MYTPKFTRWGRFRLGATLAFWGFLVVFLMGIIVVVGLPEREELWNGLAALGLLALLTLLPISKFRLHLAAMTLSFSEKGIHSRTCRGRLRVIPWQYVSKIALKSESVRSVGPVSRYFSDLTLELECDEQFPRGSCSLLPCIVVVPLYAYADPAACHAFITESILSDETFAKFAVPVPAEVKASLRTSFREETERLAREQWLEDSVGEEYASKSAREAHEYLGTCRRWFWVCCALMGLIPVLIVAMLPLMAATFSEDTGRKLYPLFCVLLFCIGVWLLNRILYYADQIAALRRSVVKQEDGLH